eukprot:4588693-Pleurochrysis_carterae.AAC.1
MTAQASHICSLMMHGTSQRGAFLACKKRGEARCPRSAEFLSKYLLPASRAARAGARYVGLAHSLNEYATCYISCYTRIPPNAKWPHVGVFGALYRA